VRTADSLVSQQAAARLSSNANARKLVESQEMVKKLEADLQRERNENYKLKSRINDGGA
jgi:hypothetical protein